MKSTLLSFTLRFVRSQPIHRPYPNPSWETARTRCGSRSTARCQQNGDVARDSTVQDARTVPSIDGRIPRSVPQLEMCMPSVDLGRHRPHACHNPRCGIFVKRKPKREAAASQVGQQLRLPTVCNEWMLRSRPGPAARLRKNVKLWKFHGLTFAWAWRTTANATEGQCPCPARTGKLHADAGTGQLCTRWVDLTSTWCSTILRGATTKNEERKLARSKIQDD